MCIGTKVRTHVLIQLDTKRVPNREDITMSDELKPITEDMLAKPDHYPKIRIGIRYANDVGGPDVTFKIKDTASLGYMIGYIEAVTNNGGSIVLSD